MQAIKLTGKIHLRPGNIGFDKDGNVLDNKEKATTYYRAGMKYNVFKKNNLIGAAGARKIYIKLNDDSGLLLFYDKKAYEKIEKYYEIYNRLSELGLYPPVSLKEIDCNVDIYRGKKKKNLNFVRSIKKKYKAILTENIEYPYIEIPRTADKKEDGGYVIFAPFYKRYKSVHPYKSDAISSLLENNLERNEEFLAENPLFTAQNYVDFCKRIEKLYKEDSFFMQMVRKGKGECQLTWGNIIYCTKHKKWFWVDFD